MRYLSITILLLVNISYAQGTFSCGYNHSTEPTVCDFVANKTYISNQLVIQKINTMVNAISLPQNFILVECDNINNAFAYVKNGIRYILIDDSWIKSIEGNNYFISGILAHEIGHHLCGHTISNENLSLEEKRNRELEADKFAGFIMRAIGSSEEEALVAINSLVPIDFDDSGSTHPTKKKRIEAIKAGYNKTNSEMVTTNAEKNQNALNAEKYFNEALVYARYPSYDLLQFNLEQSMMACKKAIELNPSFMDAYFHLACIYQALGIKFNQSMQYYYSLAFTNYNKVLALESNSPGVYNNVGMLYSDYGYNFNDYNSYLNAIRCFNSAISLDPENSAAYLNRGIANLNIGYQFRQPTLPSACNDFYTSCTLGEPKACAQYNRACRRK